MEEVTAMSAAEQAAMDRRMKLEHWKAQKEAEKAAKGQGGRERTSNIGTKDSLSASLPKTFGTPITNKLGDLGLREKSSASLGLRSQTSTASIGESAVKRVRPSSAAASAAAQLGSRGASAEPRKANAKDGRPSSAGPPAPTSSHKPQSASKTAPKSLLAHAGATAARSAKPTSPGKGAPSASAARGAARAGRQATTVAATTSSGKGARSSKAPNTAASSAPRGGRMAPPAASLAASKNGKRAGMKETTDAMDGDTMASEQPLAKEDEVSEHFEDLMAYLMPIADEDSAEGSGDEPDGANETVPGCEDVQEQASECQPSLHIAPQEAKTDAAADAQMGDGVGRSTGFESDAPPCTGAVTPHVRKVLASSDIFTPESGCESSPAAPAAEEPERVMGSTISPCISDSEKREKKSAAKRRKSSLLAFTLTPGVGPGEEGQLTPVSRSAAAAARAARASDVPLLMRPLPHDDANPVRSSPLVRPPVPSFKAPLAPTTAAAPMLSPAPLALSLVGIVLAGKARTEEPPMARPCTPSRGTSSTKDRAEGGAGARTPGSAVRRTGLSGTPRRVKSPFPRAPGLSGTPQRVLLAPSPGSKGAGPRSAQRAATNSKKSST